MTYLSKLPKERFTHLDIINLGLLDHQLIFCVRNISRIKKEGTHKQNKFCLFKYYLSGLFDGIITIINFFKYQKFSNANEA